ncbi:MAG: hypothetical protein WA900_10055 [Casimicrobiaceae bacterium]
MTAVEFLRLKAFPRAAFGAGLLIAVASAAWAPVPTQDLTIGFQPAGSGVTSYR